MVYSVVLLDGKERQNLSLDEIKDLFFKRQLNQNSLVSSSENPHWQMLKRAFDVANWIPSAAPAQNAFPLPNNPFAQPNQFQQPNNFQTPPNQFAQNNQPVYQNSFQTPPNQFQPPTQPQNSMPPVTFNQFPPNQPVNPKNPYAANAANGYSQNNQSETYYQAESGQTNYNFQNNNANFAPSKYNNQPNSYNNGRNFADNSATRNGAKQAAVFLIINAFFYVIFNVIMSAFSVSSDADGAEKFGQGVGRSFIPLIIDLILAIKLWKLDNVESARKWVLVRAYLGFIIFGLVIPFAGLKTGEYFVSIFSLVSAFFYFISLTLVLHGKENPSPSRVMVGVGTFAIYFLVMFGTIALSVIGSVAPDLAKMELPKKNEFEKYKVEGTQFEDKTTGAKVALPEGWMMIALDNPVVHTPEARMIAVDKGGNRLTLLEVVPVPGNLDMKRQNSTYILDQLADGVVKSLKETTQKRSGFGGQNSFSEVTRLSIYVGKHPAKLLVFDKTMNGEKFKGHLLITYDELTFYVLHSWCPAAEYDTAQKDFEFFEKNFSVPDQINSAFTQSAETDKNKTTPKKNF